MMRRHLERYGRAVLLIVAVMAVSLASVAYILSQQRLKSPLAKSYTVNASFLSVAGVAPGLGLPVNVSGVQVGQITGADLKDGTGVLHLSIDPKKLPHVRTDARAVLIPNSPLKDMQVELNPGRRGRVLADGGTIPVGQTTTPIDSDDLLAALDTDTRTWFATLLNGLDVGTRGRKEDLNDLLKALGPTSAQTRKVAHVLAARRAQVARLVSNVAVLSQATSAHDRQIQTVVSASNSVLGALATQDRALRSSIAQLPGTLGTAQRTLGNTTSLARELRPALRALTPSTRRLSRTLKGSRALLQGGGLLPTDDLLTFVKAVTPLESQLRPATAALNAQQAPLRRSFGLLQRFTDILAYDPPGARRSLLYWLPWFGHNVNSALSTADANGTVVRGLVFANCASAAGDNAAQQAVVGQLLQATGACATGGGG